MNPGTTKVSDAMIATTVEAILGAVHLDGGDDTLKTVMQNFGLSHTLLTVKLNLHYPYNIIRTRISALINVYIGFLTRGNLDAATLRIRIYSNLELRYCITYDCYR